MIRQVRRKQQLILYRNAFYAFHCCAPKPIPAVKGGPTFREEYRGSYVPKTIEICYGLQVIALDTLYVARAGPNQLYFIDTRFNNGTASYVKEQIEKVMTLKAGGYFSIDEILATVEIKNSETNEMIFVFDPPYARVIFAREINNRNPVEWLLYLLRQLESLPCYRPKC